MTTCTYISRSFVFEKIIHVNMYIDTFQEFEEKQRFVANSPYYSNWAPRYKKQLTMALQKQVLPYESTLVKQGDPVTGIYFILS